MSLGSLSLLASGSTGRVLPEFTNNELFVPLELSRDLYKNFVNVAAFKTLYVSITSDIALTIQAIFTNDDGIHAYYSTPIAIPADAVNTTIIGFDVLASTIMFRVFNDGEGTSTIFHSSVYATRAASSPDPPPPPPPPAEEGLTQLATHSTKAFNQGNVYFDSGISWRSLSAIDWIAESISPFEGLTELGNATYRNDTSNNMVFHGEYVCVLNDPLLMRQLLDDVPQSPILPFNITSTGCLDYAPYYFVITVPVGVTLTFEWSFKTPYSARNVAITYISISLTQIK